MKRTIELFFNSELHKYTDLVGVPFTSNTQVLDLYAHKSDFFAIAEACEYIGKHKPDHPKYLKYKDKTAKQLLQEWKILTDIALESGTEKHDYLETTIDEATGFTKRKVGSISGRVQLHTVYDIIEDRDKHVLVDHSKLQFLSARYPIIYNEIMKWVEEGWIPYSEIGVFSEKYRIAGLIDLLFVKYPLFFIIDWKTNKSPIRFEPGYYDKDVNGNITDTFIFQDHYFQAPSNYLPCSVGNKYGLQLAGYTVMAMDMGLKWTGKNALFQIREQPINGTKGFEEIVTKIKMPDLNDDVRIMYEDFRKKRLNLK